MGNLAARSLTVIIISFMTTYDVHLKFTLLSEHAGIRWLLMRALQKQLPVFTEVIQIWSFLIFPMIYVPILYLPTFSESNACQASPCYDWDFRKCPGNLRRFLTFQRLLNFAENVPRCSEDV